MIPLYLALVALLPVPSMAHLAFWHPSELELNISPRLFCHRLVLLTSLFSPSPTGMFGFDGDEPGVVNFNTNRAVVSPYLSAARPALPARASRS